MRAGSEIPPGWAKVPEDMMANGLQSLSLCLEPASSLVLDSPFRSVACATAGQLACNALDDVAFNPRPVV